MSNPLLSMSTRLSVTADDLDDLKPFVNPAFHGELRTTVRQLRNSAARLRPDSPVTALPCGDAPAPVAAGVRP